MIAALIALCAIEFVSAQNSGKVIRAANHQKRYPGETG